MLDLSLFLRPHYAEYELSTVVGDWIAELEGRTPPASEHTTKSYKQALASYGRWLVLVGLEPTLAQLTEANVSRFRKALRDGQAPSGWAGGQGRRSDNTIRHYTMALKILTSWMRQRYTHTNLLALVSPGREIVEPVAGLTQTEISLIVGSLGSDYLGIRDRAFVQLMLATAARFAEIASLDMAHVDLAQGRLYLKLKGGRRDVPADVAPKALRDLKLYVSRRRLLADPATAALWLSETGAPLSYVGCYAIFERLTRATGIKCNPHRFRHTVAQHAAAQGAPVADIQDLLHHSTDRMARRYIGSARQDVAAALPARWSLAG